MRSERPSILAYRGNGVNIKFLCPRCDKPRNQLGSKTRLFKGMRRKVCAPCDSEMVR
jgi:hypothetical protein